VVQIFKYGRYLFLLLFVELIQAQPVDYYPLVTSLDSVYLLSVKKLPVNEFYKTNEIPHKIDNSQLPFFRPVIKQWGWECHIIHGICYNLGFELNRIRNLPGNLPENQLPSHFVLNFLNEGEYSSAPNFIRGWELARNVGSPSIANYGGINLGGHTRWMNGYENYYHGMRNRTVKYFSIDVKTEEGLIKLKHWLYNHMGEGESGSLANCIVGSADLTWDTLAPGTEEEGKLVVSKWGPWAGHSITIVGYNDSIRYDYNNDGQYTNHLDINNDGNIDIKDWEIGAFKIVNSFGTEWGNQGFAYMMYRLAAIKSLSGGLWANRVYVVEAREYEPLLTMKINLNHDSRNKIKISAGVSVDTSSVVPEFDHDFFIFNYQGGEHYMQGGIEEENKSIEIGLDITPLLSHVEANTPARFFLRVREGDPNGIGTGEIENFSVMDYSNGVLENPYPDVQIPLLENNVTQLSIIHSTNYDEVHITTNELEDAEVNEPYNAQLQAENGYPAYIWKIKYDFSQFENEEIFPEDNGNKITLTEGYSVKGLPFEFPFFDSLYTNIVLSMDGAIFFDDINPYRFTEMTDNTLYLKNIKSIMPLFFSANQNLTEDYGIWYSGNESAALFRWKTIVQGMNNAEMNFAVRLFATGQIDFIYGEINHSDSIEWCSGISLGDDFNIIKPGAKSLNSFTENKKFTFLPETFPRGMKLSDDGFFYGVPRQDTSSYLINFVVKDSRDIYKIKPIQFKTIKSDSISDPIPIEVSIQNFPNPFSEQTRFEFSIIEDSFVVLSIFTLEGKKVTTLVNTDLTADFYQLNWNGEDHVNNKLRNGVYFYTLSINKKQITKKLLILR